MPPPVGAKCHPSARNMLLPLAQEGHAELRLGRRVTAAEGCLARSGAQPRRRTSSGPIPANETINRYSKNCVPPETSRRNVRIPCWPGPCLQQHSCTALKTGSSTALRSLLLTPATLSAACAALCSGFQENQLPLP